MSNYDWNVRYLIEMKGISGKVPFGIYNVLMDKESVMQLLCLYQCPLLGESTP